MVLEPQLGDIRATYFLLVVDRSRALRGRIRRLDTRSGSLDAPGRAEVIQRLRALDETLTRLQKDNQEADSASRFSASQEEVEEKWHLLNVSLASWESDLEALTP